MLALLADSTNAEEQGSTASESVVGQAFHQIFAEAEGRVILACFASHIHRMQQADQDRPPARAQVRRLGTLAW